MSVTRMYLPGRHGQLHLRRSGPEAAMAAAVTAGASRAPAPRAPLACFHMSPMSGRIYQHLLAEMGRDRLALAFDTPGFGMSDAPAAPPAIEDYAADMLAGLDALGVVQPCDLMGYHTGSLIAVALARLAPTRIRRVLMVSAPIFPEEERARFRAYYGHREPEEDGAHLVRLWKSFVYHHRRPGETLAGVADIFPEALLGREREWWGHRAAFDYDLAAALAGVTQPVLILNPGDDLDVQTRRAVGLAPRSMILEAPGWGHGFLDRQTDEAAALARGFFDAPDAAPFAAVRTPPSADAPRYPARVGSFAP